MIGAWITAILGTCVRASPLSGPPKDAQQGLRRGPGHGGSAGDQLLALSDDGLVSFSRSANTLSYSVDGGENWEIPRFFDADSAVSDGGVQYVHGMNSAWLLAGDRFFHFQAGAWHFEFPFNLADRMGDSYNIVLHPTHEDAAVICGQHMCTAGSFGFASTGFADLYNATECVMDPYAQAAAWCAVRESDSIPGALVYLNSGVVSSTGVAVGSGKPIGAVSAGTPAGREHPNSGVEIDGEPVQSVSSLFTTAEWTVAVSSHRIAVKGPTKWQYAKHKPFDSVSFQQGAANGIIAHATRGGSRYLWTLSSDGATFVESDVEDAPVIGAGETLYTYNVSDPQVSYNNGHNWQAVPKVLENANFTTLLTSKRLNLLLAKGSTVIYSYDGAEWHTAALPVKNNDDVSLMLVDEGSAVVCWRRKSNEAFITQSSDLSSWEPLMLPLTNPLSDYAWAASPESPKLVFKSDSETAILDLTPFMGNGTACSASDLARIDHEKCVLGSKISIQARKPGTKCVMGPLVENQYSVQRCACTTEDYSCGSQYMAKGSECVPDEGLQERIGKCEAGSKQIVPRPFIPVLGTQCQEGVQFASNAYHECGSSSVVYSDNPIGVEASNSGVSANIKEMSGRMRDYLYLPGYADDTDEETLLVWNNEGDLFVSMDQGTSWKQPEEVRHVLNIYKSDTDDNQIYAITENSMDDKVVWVSWDRARTFERINLPATPSLVFSFMPDIVTFHPAHPEWMLFTGMEECDSLMCPGVSFLSKDRGKTWKQFTRETKFCQWVTGLALPTDENLVYCIDVDIENLRSPVKLSWSTDYYASGPNFVDGLSAVVNVAVDGEYVIVSHLNDFEEPEIKISRDGINFEPANYPANIKFSKTSAATVVTTESKSIKLFQTVSSKISNEFGVLLKSDERGTNFITSLANVNRASRGFFSEFIDYDRLQSVKGVAIANVVSNPDDVLRRGADKKLRTVITHSEGAFWDPLEGPLGQQLQLHGYTDRLDVRNQPSSPSAVGLMFGRGNEGDELGPLRTAHTYMTRDAGITWKQVSERPMFWEFGDSGSVIVLIDSMEPTNMIKFSLDEGETWQEYQFAEVAVKVVNLATIPSDTSRKFIIFGVPPVAYGDKTLVIQLDFSGLESRVCSSGDFEWWSPSHPRLESKCLLGQEVEYRRKKAGHQCVVGKSFDDNGKPLGGITRVVQNCKCTRHDYECDVNYTLGADGRCELIPEAEEPTKEVQCANGAIAWHKVTGYRKIATSTCEDGEQLASSEEFACPGKEKEFDEQRKGGNGADDHKNDSSPGLFSRIGNFIFYAIVGVVFTLLLAGLVYVGYNTFTKYRSRISLGGVGPSVQFPDAEYPQRALHRSYDAAEGVLSHAAGIWRLVRSSIPFFGSQVPQDRLGFYSRMSDDERYRLLEEEGFEDESEGNEDVFIDEEDAPGPTAFADDFNGHTDSPFVDDAAHDSPAPSSEAAPAETDASRASAQEYHDSE